MECTKTQVKKSTRVIKKNNINPYWDEELILELPPQPEESHLDPATPIYDTLEFESCHIEVRCYDWDRIGRQTIGDVESIPVEQIIAKRGTEACFSSPDWYKLKAKSKIKRPAQANNSDDQIQDSDGGANFEEGKSTGALALAINVEWALLSSSQAQSMNIDLANVKQYVYNDEDDLTSAVSMPIPFNVSVCLLGARELPSGLRHPSVEVGIDHHRHGVSNSDEVAKLEARGYSKVAQHSKRMYTVGEGNNPNFSNCSWSTNDVTSGDFDSLRRSLERLDSKKLRERASIAGVDPYSDSDDGRREKLDKQSLVNAILRAYKECTFKGILDPECLHVRLYEKPALDIAGRTRHRRQPQQLVAHIDIPLTSRTSRSDVRVLRPAKKLYHQAMKLLVAASEGGDGCNELAFSGVLQPSTEQMAQLVAEVQGANDTTGIIKWLDPRPQLVCTNCDSEQTASLGEAMTMFRDCRATLQCPTCGSSLRVQWNLLEKEVNTSVVSTRQQHSASCPHRYQAKRTEAIALFNEAISLVEASKAQSGDTLERDRLLTNLKSGKRKAEVGSTYGTALEPWEHRRHHLDGDWETSGSNSSRSCNFSRFPMFDKCGREHGYIRLAFQKSVQDAQATLRWGRIIGSTKPRNVVVRVYVIEAVQLRPPDRQNTANPYVLATMSGPEQQVMGDRKEYIKHTLSPEFRQMFEFFVQLPGPAVLTLTCKNWQRFKPDDDIGHTVIDLERRWYCDQWQASEPKPIEHRPLHPRSRMSTQIGAGSCGTLKLWVDIVKQPSDSTSLPLPVDITKPDPEPFQLRVVVWSATEMLDVKGNAASSNNDAISDTYFSGHLRSMLGRQVEEQEQKTDIHWRSKGGRANFNYRMVFDFQLERNLPVKRPCAFTLKAWDKDPVLLKSSLLGFAHVPLDELIDDAMRDAIQMKTRRQHIDELMKTGRLSEMEECLRVYEAENKEQEAKRERSRDQAKKERAASDFGLLDGSNNSFCKTSPMDCCHTLFQRKADGLLDDALDDSGHDGEDGALSATGKYRSTSEHTWMLRNLHGKTIGKVGVSVELLHADVAVERKCGKGRSSPNEHPVLEDPERETISIFKPLGALKFLVRIT